MFDMAPSPTFIIVHFFGISSGIFSIVMVVMTRRKMGGQISQAFLYVMLGSIFETLALISSIFFDEARFYPVFFHHLHDIMMAVGLLSFAIAAKKFAGLSK